MFKKLKKKLNFLKKEENKIPTKLINGREFVLEQTAQSHRKLKEKRRVLLKGGYTIRIHRRGMGEYDLWAAKKT